MKKFLKIGCSTLFLVVVVFVVVIFIIAPTPMRFVKALPHLPKYVMCITYEDNGEYGKALNCFSELIISQPEAYNYLQRGLLLEKMVRYEEAMKDYKTAVKLDPKEGKAYYRMGTIYEKDGKYKEAIDSYTNAIKCYPNEGYYYYKRGKLYLELGDETLAKKDFTRSCELKGYGCGYLEDLR